MKVPFNWLKEYVEVDAEPAALAERLTFSGSEVESVDIVGPDLKGIVAAEIIAIEPHPRAERLLLCDVSDGQDILRVVCGARNFAVGDKVPLARAGATLPNGTAIQAAAIRGEQSQGMLCAEDELGLSEDHAGLMLLPKTTAAGTALTEIIGPPEPVLTMEITPNRPDCLSIIGIAREVAALYNSRLKWPAVQLAENGPAVDTRTSVKVEDPEGCPRYIARILSGVAIAPSPFWMQRRLTLCGVRPINAIVDITNYVMLECGQPLHAFDQSLLAEGRIVVRRAQPGEVMPTLDGIERKLSPATLIIADARQPVAVAGVMGGAASGILATTRTVLLESACFQPALIRSASKALGLSTESSYRFERGVDIRTTDWASRRAAALMVACAGATAAPGALDIFPVEPRNRRITCRFDRVRAVLGLDLPDNRITRCFEALELPVRDRNQAACVVEAPAFRPDLETEADLIEEAARLTGLDQIPTAAPRARIVPGARDAAMRAAFTCRAHLTGLGLSEIMNYSFVSETLLNLVDPAGAGQRVILPHPISADHAVLRNSLLPQMVETLGRNRFRQITEAAFFEIGRVFFKLADKTLAEEERLAIGLMGAAGRSGLDRHRPPTEEDMFLWLKGILENLAAALSMPVENDSVAGGAPGGLTWRPLRAGPGQPAGFPAACFQENRALAIELDGGASGVLGLLQPALRREWRLQDPVAILEVRLTPLWRHLAATPALTPLPVYPSVIRDMALLVDHAMQHATIVQALRRLAPKELTAIQLFDIFKSKEMGVGKKSMAYSLTYRSADRTLTDDEVNVLHAAVKAGLRKALTIEIREG